VYWQADHFKTGLAFYMGLYAMFGVLQAVSSSRFSSTLATRLDPDLVLSFPIESVLHSLYGLLYGSHVLPRVWSTASQFGLEAFLRSHGSVQLDSS